MKLENFQIWNRKGQGLEPRYNEVPRLAKCVRYNEVSLHRGSFSYILLFLGQRKSSVIPRTSLYRGSTVYVYYIYLIYADAVTHDKCRWRC